MHGIRKIDWLTTGCLFNQLVLYLISSNVCLTCWLEFLIKKKVIWNFHLPSQPWRMFSDEKYFNSKMPLGFCAKNKCNFLRHFLCPSVRFKSAIMQYFPFLRSFHSLTSFTIQQWPRKIAKEKRFMIFSASCRL